MTESAEHPKINRKEVYILRPDDAKPNYMLDTCCAPIPGDDVLGFIDDDENVIVHKVNCPTAMRLKSSFGSRLVATRWEGKADAFMATIGVDGIDRHGILEAITKVVSQDLGINIRGLNIAAKQEVFHCELSVMIDTTETVDNICAELKKIDNVKIRKAYFLNTKLCLRNCLQKTGLVRNLLAIATVVVIIFGSASF